MAILRSLSDQEPFWLPDPPEGIPNPILFVYHSCDRSEVEWKIFFDRYRVSPEHAINPLEIFDGTEAAIDRLRAACVEGGKLLTDEFVVEVRRRITEWPAVHLNTAVLADCLAKGQFEDAEKVIAVIRPDYLNEGVGRYTPLNLALNGSSTGYRICRNLRIAKLLVMRGADPNLRMGNNGIFDETVSPIEQLVNLYEQLLDLNAREVDAGWNRNRGKDVRALDAKLIVGLNGDLCGSIATILSHVKDLFLIFFDYGADVNHVTRRAGQTVFHRILALKEADVSFIENLLDRGALVNLADIHGTSPFMDRIRSCGNVSRVYELAVRSERQLRLDVLNCRKESAFSRAFYYGQLEVANLLLNAADPDSMVKWATVRSSRLSRLSTAPLRISTDGSSPPFMRVTETRRLKQIPVFLTPLLYESPCLEEEGDISTPWEKCFIRLPFLVPSTAKVIRRFISPLVERHEKHICHQVEYVKWIKEQLAVHTNYKHLLQDGKFLPESVIPTLFGRLNSGSLRQRCIRTILYTDLFVRNTNEVTHFVENFHNTKRKRLSGVRKSSGSGTASEKSGQPHLYSDRVDVSFNWYSTMEDVETPPSPPGQFDCLPPSPGPSGTLRRVPSEPLFSRLNDKDKIGNQWEYPGMAGKEIFGSVPTLNGQPEEDRCLNPDLMQYRYQDGERRHRPTVMVGDTEISLDELELEISRQSEAGAFRSSQEQLNRLKHMLKETDHMLDDVAREMDAVREKARLCTEPTEPHRWPALKEALLNSMSEAFSDAAPASDGGRPRRIVPFTGAGSDNDHLSNVDQQFTTLRCQMPQVDGNLGKAMAATTAVEARLFADKDLQPEGSARQEEAVAAPSSSSLWPISNGWHQSQVAKPPRLDAHPLEAIPIVGNDDLSNVSLQLSTLKCQMEELDGALGKAAVATAVQEAIPFVSDDDLSNVDLQLSNLRCQMEELDGALGKAEVATAVQARLVADKNVQTEGSVHQEVPSSSLLRTVTKVGLQSNQSDIIELLGPDAHHPEEAIPSYDDVSNDDLHISTMMSHMERLDGMLDEAMAATTAVHARLSADKVLQPVEAVAAPSSSSFSCSSCSSSNMSMGSIPNTGLQSSQSHLIKMLRPDAVRWLCRNRWRIPPGLVPYVELEVAGLQLCRAIYGHEIPNCYSDCELNLLEEDEFDDEDDDDENDDEEEEEEDDLDETGWLPEVDDDDDYEDDGSDRDSVAAWIEPWHTRRQHGCSVRGPGFVRPMTFSGFPPSTDSFNSIFGTESNPRVAARAPQPDTTYVYSVSPERPFRMGRRFDDSTDSETD